MNELTAEYLANGLTYKSNNESVITRDAAGNVYLNDTSNNVLIIEPVTTKITMNSALRVFDTQFNYYSFPVTTVELSESGSFELNEDLNLATNETDIIYAMYQPNGTVTLADSGQTWSGIDMSIILNGNPQQYVNKYYITNDIKQSGSDLRMRLKIRHSYKTKNDGTPKNINDTTTSNVIWSIIKSGLDGEIKNWKTFTSTVDGRITAGKTETLIADIIIQNSEIKAGDKLSIGARANNDHLVFGEQSYWSITDASKNVDIWNNEIV